MTSRWRQRVTSAHQEETSRWFRDLESSEPPSDEQLEAERWRNRLETAQTFDPGVQLGEELALRFTGPNASGGLPFDMGGAIMKPIQDSVASTDSSVSLKLTGVSEGSTVLHVHPVVASAASDNDDEPLLIENVRLSADRALRRFIDLVTAVEARTDVRSWSGMFANIDSLVSVLDKFDMELYVGWRPFSGEIYTSRLTSRGKEYVRSLRETRSDSEVFRVSGRIVELKFSGFVKVKVGARRNSRAYEIKIDIDQLIGMHLELGQQVTFLIRKDQVLDRVGIVRERIYTFVGQEEQKAISRSLDRD